MIKLFNRLKNIFTNTSSKIGNGIKQLFVKNTLDQLTLDQLEEILLSADIGAQVSCDIINALKKRKMNQEVTADEIKEDLINIIQEILGSQVHDFRLFNQQLNIIIVCGANGNGKTTTIGKLASEYSMQGKKVAIAACDTFRAAAVDQIAKWAKDSGATLFQGKEKCDPASVAHRAVVESLSQGIDILLIDTAGRLHNHKNLMDELVKIIKVVKKVNSPSTHHILLVIDGTTGQNAINQVEKFKEIVDITGLVITKLDATAKAGTIVEIVSKFALPVHFIGTGEKSNDLKLFSSEEFAKSLVDNE